MFQVRVRLRLKTYERGNTFVRITTMFIVRMFLATESEATPATPGPIDYSIYRTPSGRDSFSNVRTITRQIAQQTVSFAGQYYCAPCNLSLNSESTFAQHVESKKHKNQSNPKSPSNAIVVSKKARFKKK